MSRGSLKFSRICGGRGGCCLRQTKLYTAQMMLPLANDVRCKQRNDVARSATSFVRSTTSLRCLQRTSFARRATSFVPLAQHRRSSQDQHRHTDTEQSSQQHEQKRSGDRPPPPAAGRLPLCQGIPQDPIGLGQEIPPLGSPRAELLSHDKIGLVKIAAGAGTQHDQLLLCTL